MHVFESYWDMSPPEVQEHVIGFKISQECIDKERKDKIKNLCNDIEKYGLLKEKCSAVAWGGAGGARAPPIIWQTQKNIY